MQEWLPPDMLDLHGYVTPTLIEATTKPHNPSIDYDLWLKWNQARIDANEAAVNATGRQIQRPINDWCANPNEDIPPPGQPCSDGRMPGPAVAEGWDDWGPFYTPMYSQHIGLNGSTVETCDYEELVTCGGSTASLRDHVTISWSTLLFNVGRRNELLHDELELYRRGVTGAARPACCPPPFHVENNWMHEYPTAYVIPVGLGQRSDAEATRLVDWLLFNGIEVSQLKENATVNGEAVERGSYVVLMKQPHRGLADTALGIGVDISQRISVLYAPPAAWSHGYLWGADILSVPNGTPFTARTELIRKTDRVKGGIDHGNAEYYALRLNSATAVRALNSLLRGGLTAKVATAPFTRADGRSFPAGTVLFAASAATKEKLGEAGREFGLFFWRVHSTQLSLEDVAKSPRIAVFTNAVDQSVWSLRNLGFAAEPVGTALLNGPGDPLAGFDVLFSTAGWPTDPNNQPGLNAPTRAKLTAFFAGGGDFIGAGTGGVSLVTNAGGVAGLTAASRGGSGRSGIVWWQNTGGLTSLITGAYSAQDTAIMDPPTWFTRVPTAWSIDANLPMSGFFAAGLWRMDTQSASAPGAPLAAHGTGTNASSRIVSFAFNPLYRADPEREWPMLASAALWVDD
jgi:hypothetical protein